MKKPVITIILSALFLIGQSISAQNTNKKPQTNAPKHYPNPYDTPDPNRPVAQDPFTWKNFPADIDSSATMQKEYQLALNKNDGYRLLQLGKLEYDKSCTYGTLNPNKMIAEAFRIAVNNQDPFLTFYLTQFNVKENFSAIIDTTEKMAKITYELALKRKEIRVLNLLADVKDTYFLMEKVSSKELRKQALFINNKNFAPYPNPYDNPDAAKPLNISPCLWADFPSGIATEAQLKEAYTNALKNNDGYRLLQLAKIASDKPLSKTLTAEILLSKAYAIAQYNKDPYLMIHITFLEKEKNILKNTEPADIFRKAYNAAVERKDVSALSLIYDFEKSNDFLPELTSNKILLKIKELKDTKPIM